MYFQTRTKIDINRCIFIVKEVFYTPNKVRHGEHEYFGLPPPSNGTALLIIVIADKKSTRGHLHSRNNPVYRISCKTKEEKLSALSWV